ncbi:MAG: hypothetical protein RLZZ500_1562 [Bacteroidota bacterium]|jgi:glycosyltransferase involved in cell wall biosynthesis
MTFCIISHVIHTAKEGHYFGYGPYIKEMNIWLQYADKVIVVAPLEERALDAIHLAYQHPNIEFIPVPHFSFTSFSNALKALWVIPFIFFKILGAYRKSDHLHLRCPGNMGLLGAWAQLFFPRKVKTAKYAGNWDPKAKQPLTYKWQRSVLSSTFWTKNMKVLVYGEWPNQTKNVKSFFTASYAEGEALPNEEKQLDTPLQLVFVGSLAAGKRPLYAIDLVRKLQEKGIPTALSLYGKGALEMELATYIQEYGLQDSVFLKGNVDANAMKSVYLEAHFLVLPSKSEGWPKVVAEALFWGCVPLVTPVSCVANMLDEGNRGVLLTLDLTADCEQIQALISSSVSYKSMREKGIQWSRNYTTTAFDQAIKQLMKP